MRTIIEFNRLCRNFLGNGPDVSTPYALIAYEDLCLPYEEGGLSIRNLEIVNKAAVMRNIWFVVTKKDTLWVTWVWKHLIRERVLATDHSM